jgi:hypothetical protein
MQFTDHRFFVLSKLRSNAPVGHSPRSLHTIEGYRRAVLAVVTALEESAAPDELWSAGVDAANLTDSHRLGEHIAATRRQFGFCA